MQRVGMLSRCASGTNARRLCFTAVQQLMWRVLRQGCRMLCVLFNHVFAQTVHSNTTCSMCDALIWVCSSCAAAAAATPATLQALQQPPDSNLFRFGLAVVRLSKPCLHLDPEFCASVLATPHVKRVDPGLTAHIESIARAEKAAPFAVAPSHEITLNYQAVCRAVSASACGTMKLQSMHRLCLCCEAPQVLWLGHA